MEFGKITSDMRPIKVVVSDVWKESPVDRVFRVWVVEQRKALCPSFSDLSLLDIEGKKFGQRGIVVVFVFRAGAHHPLPGTAKSGKHSHAVELGNRTGSRKQHCADIFRIWLQEKA